MDPINPGQSTLNSFFLCNVDGSDHIIDRSIEARLLRLQAWLWKFATEKKCRHMVLVTHHTLLAKLTGFDFHNGEAKRFILRDGKLVYSPMLLVSPTTPPPPPSSSSSSPSHVSTTTSLSVSSSHPSLVSLDKTAFWRLFGTGVPYPRWFSQVNPVGLFYQAGRSVQKNEPKADALY